MAPRNKELSEQMRAESREQILDAARRLFARQGYFGTKVSDIARESGMSQGNLYWYFSSKEDVLKAVLEEGFQTVETLVQNTEAYQGTGREKIAYLIDQTLALYQEQWEFLSITQRLLAHGGVPLFKELGFDTPQIGERLHHHLSAVFAQARDEGLIADIDPNIHAMFFFALVNGLVMTYGEDWLTLATPEWVRDGVLRLLGIDTTD
jgi:AcrR family transcriptional regulator